MSDREFDEAETRVLERLRFLGNGANILSFGRDTGVVDRLIRRGYLREVRMFGVEFSPTPPAVQKTDANPSPSEAPPVSRPKTVPSRRQRKPQFSRFEAVGDRSKAIAGRIFEFLEWAGPQTKRQIERRLHSCR